MNSKLLDGQGNFGSLDGDRAAAMRYTETKLAKISEYLVSDIDKNTVNFQNNYDDTETEPVVLPAQFPNLLVNGAGGIAVGMATSIPPHNLSEVINATLALIENKDIFDISFDELNKRALKIQNNQDFIVFMRNQSTKSLFQNTPENINEIMYDSEADEISSDDLNKFLNDAEKWINSHRITIKKEESSLNA